jgi:hypothetical protein
VWSKQHQLLLRATISRKFRGIEYKIEVKNPNSICKGVKQVTVDGLISGSILSPLFPCLVCFTCVAASWVNERAFATRGAEVRVTQASRDRGVDAVVFDPDPIKGGKIIIQAKRYSATVDLSAVRDLYGTIQAEGANKGILVMTSDFSPDAYEFAAGKPITLLNGANLLHLLSEHGYQARIDLQEARALLRERGGSAI